MILILIAVIMAIAFLVYKILNKYMKNKKVQSNISYSFLLGSGFSVPKGLPKVGEINAKFTSIGIKNFCINSDSTISFFEKGYEEDDRFSRNERLFLVEFIADYCQNVINGTQDFQYEQFYDYYFSYYRGEENVNITVFCQSFRNKYSLSDGLQSDNNLLMNFNNYFVQILGELLGRKEFYENNCFKMDNSPYNDFIQYLKYLIEQGDTINIHTLNHDILFEHLILCTDLRNEFSDGFSDLGSPYYGDYSTSSEGISMKYRVRIKCFQNKYEKAIRLYKLHGSIDTFYFNLASPDVDKTRVKSEYGVFDFYKEIQNTETKELEYSKGHSNPYPDFLSGTTEKLRSYGNEYYSILFKHFEQNLNQTDKLIIIGYGGWDDGINKILSQQFLNKGLVPTVIDPYPLKSPFFNPNGFKHVQKSIDNITFEEFQKL